MITKASQRFGTVRYRSTISFIAIAFILCCCASPREPRSQQPHLSFSTAGSSGTCLFELERSMSTGAPPDPILSIAPFYHFPRTEAALPTLPAITFVPEEWASRALPDTCGAVYSSEDNFNAYAQGLSDRVEAIHRAYTVCPSGTQVALWKEAWCRVAAEPCGTPFSREAHEICTTLETFSIRKHEILERINRDWSILDAFLLRVDLDSQQKAAALGRFKKYYPMLEQLGLSARLEESCARLIRPQTVQTAHSESPPPSQQWVTFRGGLFERGGTIRTAPVSAPLPKSERTRIYDFPRNTVIVAPFEVQTAEVTASDYLKCVRDGSCVRPSIQKNAELRTFEIEGKEHHPMNYIAWTEARRYCEWLGARLPSEVEWEFAARSGGTDRPVPWDGAEACDRSVSIQTNGDEIICGDPASGTADVCTHPSGNTDQGVCDLIGNLWEWVEDSRHDTYCGAPSGSTAWEERKAEQRVLRGGSWKTIEPNAFQREAAPSTHRAADIGFRCARDTIRPAYFFGAD